MFSNLGVGEPFILNKGRSYNFVMALDTAVLTYDTSEIVDSLVDEMEAERLLAINPSHKLLRSLSRTDTESVAVNILADSDVVRRTYDDFISSSHASMFQRDGDFEVRTTDNFDASPLLVTEDTVITISEVGQNVLASEVTNGSVVDEVYEFATSAYEDGDEYELVAPPYDVVLDTLGEEVGEELRGDFESILENFDDISIARAGIDVVEVLLLLAARRELLLYEVSKWGQEIDLASKATFSRAKSRLDDRGLIRTVKVPVTVGRPRLRLLTAEDLANMSPTDLIREATIRFEGRRQQIR